MSIMFGGIMNSNPGGILGSGSGGSAIKLIRQDATYTYGNNTSIQKMFGSTTNGAISLDAGVYFFVSESSISSMDPTSGNLAFELLGAGTATLAAIMYSVFGSDGNANSAATQTGRLSTTNASAAPISAGTGTGLQMTIQGTFEVSTTGTIIPSITLTNAAAAVLAIGSFFMVWKASSNLALTSIGSVT